MANLAAKAMKEKRGIKSGYMMITRQLELKIKKNQLRNSGILKTTSKNAT